MGDTLIGCIITAAVSLIGIYITAKSTQDAMTQKLDTNQQKMDVEIKHIKENISEMKEDIKQHNNYARLFQENIPAIKQHQTDTDRRIAAIETKQG